MFKQTIAITAMNLRAIPQRLGTSSVIVVGIAGVVAVLVSVLAMATGFHKTVANSGRADRAIVLRGGSQAEINSSTTRDVPELFVAICAYFGAKSLRLQADRLTPTRHGRGLANTTLLERRK